MPDQNTTKKFDLHFFLNTIGGSKTISKILGIFVLTMGIGAGVALVLQPQLLNQKAAEIKYDPYCSSGMTQCLDDKTLQVCSSGYLYPANCPTEQSCYSSGGVAGCGPSGVPQGGGGFDTTCETEVYKCPGKRAENGFCLDIADSCPTQEVAAAIASAIKPNPTITPKPTSGTGSTALEGYLRVVIEDDFENKTSREKYFLQDDNNVMSPISYGGKLNIIPGSRIRISTNTDYTAGVALALADAENVQVVSQGAGETFPIGNKRVAIVLFQFLNFPFTSPTSSDVLSVFNNNVKPFYEESSFGKLILNADVYGKYTLQTASNCSSYSIQSVIDMIDPDVNFNNYEQVILVYKPDTSCGNDYGWGNIGTWTYNTKEGPKPLSFSADTVLAWESSLTYFKFVMAHEMGHNYGVMHANGWDCGTTSLGDNCTVVEYGDRYDIMGGNTGKMFHFGPSFKEYFKWLDPVNVKSVTSSGRFIIYPIEKSSLSAMTLKIPQEGTANSYYIENREAFGFDSTMPSTVVNGMIVKFAIPLTLKQATQTIDSTPATDYFDDASYSLGSSFIDPDRGLSVTPVSKTNGALTVDVKFHGPTLISPTNGAANPTKTFTWAAIPKATNYKIWVGTDSNFTTKLVDTVVTGTSYTASNLPTNTTLYWTVRANYSFGSSDFTPSRNTIVRQFTNLTGTFVQNRATFNFTYPVASTYVVEMANTPGFTSGIYRNFGTGSSSPITVTDPTKWTGVYVCGANLWWRVVAADGTTSQIIPALVDCSSLIPTLLSPANNGFANPSNPSFDWTDAPGAIGYDIQTSFVSDFSNILDITASTVSSNYTANKLIQGSTKFYWRVRSKFQNGLSSWSPTFTFTSNYPPASPSRYSPADGSMAPSDKPLLTWGTVGSMAGINDYYLQVSSTRDFTNLVVNSHLGLSTSYQFTTGLTPGANYYWRVQAKDNVGQTSTHWDFSTFTVPASGATSQTVTYQVNASSDDYNVNCDNTTNNTSTSLTLGALTGCTGKTGHTASFVFKNVQIPKYAGIVDAHLEVVSAANNTSDFTLYQNISANGLTDSVEWPITANWSNNQSVSSTNFAKAVGSIVSYQSWTPGNSMTARLTFKDGSGSGTRTIKSYDAGSTSAAKLVVTYIPKPIVTAPTPVPGAAGSCTVTVSPLTNMSNQPVLLIGQLEQTTSVTANTTASGGTVNSVVFEPTPFWNSTWVNFDVCSSNNSICPTFSSVYTDTATPFNAKITAKYNHSFGPLKVTAVMNTGATCSTVVMMGGSVPSCFTFKDQNGINYQDNIPWNFKSGNTYIMNPTKFPTTASVDTIVWSSGVYDAYNVLRSSTFSQAYPLPVTYKFQAAGTSYSIIAGRPNYCKIYSYYTVK